jgi:hypothetical protein
MRTTGPILAIGGVTLANQSLLGNRPVDWRIPIATGILAGMFAIFEHVQEDAAVAVAWLALGTILLTRINNQPSPAEHLLSWVNRR